MKVLILHQHFKVPQKGGAIRSYYLAKALVEKGIHTVIITAHNEPHYRTEEIEGAEVHFLPVSYDNRFGFYKRIISFSRFVMKAIRLAGRHRDADVCYAISTPLTAGLAAMIIRTQYRIPFLFEIGDLWPDAPIALGFVRNPILKRVLFRMERSVYRNAYALVALSPAIRDQLHRKIRGKIVHLIPNMADTDFFKPEPKQSALEEKFRVRDKFVVSYVGALGMANGLDYFLECAAASQQAGLPIHFLLCGDGARLDHLRSSAQRKALQNLTMVPFQNRRGVAEVMNVTDANFICYLPATILETGSPNKYFDGLAAGKLTVINFGGWIREEIEREQCGIAVDPHNCLDFISKIAGFIHDPVVLRKYQQAARALAERKYARRILSERYSQVITNSVQ